MEKRAAVVDTCSEELCHSIIINNYFTSTTHVTNMESDERPTKMRKLEHEDPQSEQNNEQQPAAEEEAVKTKTVSTTTTADHENGETSQEAEEEALQMKTVSTKTTANDENGETSQEVAAIQPTLSKNQQKKLRKRLEWESGRENRKIIRKEKQKQKRERIRAEKASLPPPPPQQQQEESSSTTITATKHHPPRPRQLPITILIDCNFDNLMREGERTSLSSQITRCYSDNRNSPYRAHLVLSSFGGSLKERFEGVLESVHKLWKPFRTFSEPFPVVAEMAKEWMADEKENFLTGSFSRHAATERETLRSQGEIVYLSSEATSDLTELKPYSTYIIGGLVDKNREKGICFKRAQEAGITTKRLPIGKFLDMSSRKVLATNHVSEIMVRWLECGDWGEAFMKVIPKRKGGVLKGSNGSNKAGREEEEDGEDD